VVGDFIRDCAMQVIASLSGSPRAHRELLDDPFDHVLAFHHLMAKRTLFGPRDFATQVWQVVLQQAP
jgi:hypothetical protein